ncbi:hypothetical protein FB451DRAFT_1400627 [Mycena latifolia]|nr:hypothetical protein FB451DRAFT_1400627 [Mycena latifolia]
MPAPTSSKSERWSPVTLLRDLLTTVALCYVITLGLLRCIALHLEFFAPSATCGLQGAAGQPDYGAYQRAITNIPRMDVLKVTTGCSVFGFAALELCVLLARRAGITTEDPECGMAASHPPSDKLLEKSAD